MCFRTYVFSHVCVKAITRTTVGYYVVSCRVVLVELTREMMCVCMYVRVCVCVCVCMCACVCVCCLLRCDMPGNAVVDESLIIEEMMCVCVSVYVCMYVCMCVCVCVCVCVCMCACVCVLSIA